MNSDTRQLVTVALISSLATAGGISAYNAWTRQRRRQNLNEDIKRSLLTSIERTIPTETPSPAPEPRSRSTPSRTGSKPSEYDEGLIREQLARNYAFFGEEGMAKVRGGSVVIVGCGGVGSWAAVMLVRSGVSKIRLVDFDQVTLSSLNRHATAGLDDVGTSKVKCIEKALRQISRSVEIDSRNELWRAESGAELLEGMDWVVDAIDNIQTKVDLLKYCYDNKRKVFSSLGAGAKSDPTRIQISDISYTMYDPLARSVRRRLRMLGVPSGIPVVYSTEVPSDVKLLPLPEEEFEKGNVKELGAFDDFRVRILPVLGPLPSIFGLHIATYIICELAGKPINNPLPVRYRKRLYERLYKDLLVRERKIFGQSINKLPIDEDDCGMIFDDLYRGRSIIPPYDVPQRPILVRWEVSKPLTIDNCAALEFRDAEKHANLCLGENNETGVLQSPREVWGEEVQAVFERRRAEIVRVRNCVM